MASSVGALEYGDNRVEQRAIDGNGQERQRGEAVEDPSDHGHVSADGKEDQKGQEEIEIADDRASAAELRVECLPEIEPHLLADDFTGPLCGDEDEAEDQPHGRAEDDFAADGDSQGPG